MEQNISNSKIDLSDFFSKFKRHWWWFLISIFVCLALAFTYIKVKRPVYDITAKILVTSDDGGGMGGSIMKNLSLLGQGSAETDDEVEILSSHTILVKALKSLKQNRVYSNKTGLLTKKVYYNNSPIEIQAPDALMDTLSESISFKVNIKENGKADIVVKKGFFTTYLELEDTELPTTINIPYGKYSITKTNFFVPGEEYKIRASIGSYSGISEKLTETISIYPASKKSNSITITTQSADVKKDKDLINKIIFLYNERGVDVKNEIAQKTKQFIDERLNILYGDLSKSESNIEQFKKTNNFVDLGAETQYQLTKKGSLEGQLLSIESEIMVSEMVKSFLQKRDNKYSLIPFTTGKGAATEAINNYNGLILEYIKLMNNAKQDNIVLKSLQKQIDALRGNVLESVDKELDASKIIRNELASKSASSISKLGNIPTQEKAFIDLKRSQTVQNYLYSFLLQKKEENELVLAAAIPKGQIIDNAYSSAKPVKPIKPLIVIGALLFGLLIPIIIIYTIELFKTKFNTTDELSKITSLPILGEICHNHKETCLVVKNGRTSSIVELFRLIRNNIQFMLPNNDDKVILITSSISGEGKSFASSNIASSLALLNKKVVIVGMDIRSPQLSKNFEIQSAPGLTNYLSDNNIDLTSITQQSHLDNLDVIVAGPIPPNPSELLLSSRVNELITVLKEKYDYIVLDSAPIALVSDTFSLNKYADMTIYVTRANYTKKQFIKYINDVATRRQLTNVALIVNDTDSKLSHGYGYGYGKSNEEEE
ncbi:MAG: polysaccharide biosynthesis tyrosine autokinase [Muribaculaceae bacterium]|nr:polysaccharide biosynthesis tyrosine autokinase [Muribaculaceae bacterium]